jgi:CubicO group peptidase (beta-lactamase class C family)
MSSLEGQLLDRYPLDVRVNGYAQERLVFEPGTEFLYGNLGFNTAARIIELLTAMKFEDFLQQRVFDPLHMLDTTFWPDASQRARLAKTYAPNWRENSLTGVPITYLVEPLDDRIGRHCDAGGGLFSSAADMAKFCQMFLQRGTFAGQRIISEAAITEMTTNQSDAARRSLAGPKPRVDIPNGYGLGWRTYESGTVGHAGAYHTDMRVDFKRELAAIWLVQHAEFIVDGGTYADVFFAAMADV